MATYNLRDGIPSRIKAGDVLNYPYLKTVNNQLINYGGAVTVPLPKGEYILEVWGSCAGTISNIGTISKYQHDGSGGYAKGTLRLNSKTDAILTAGGPGYNGAYNRGGSLPQGSGGASDIRLARNTINNRVIVAGGGAEYGQVIMLYYTAGEPSEPVFEGYIDGGYAGGPTGADGDWWNQWNNDASGKGGTQTSGGANGSDRWGHTEGTPGAFGMGGYGSQGFDGAGGWYGGGAGVYYTNDVGAETWFFYGAGGGGSSFAYSQDTQQYVPNSYALTSQYWLTNTVNISGHDSGQKITSPEGTQEAGHNSGGYVRITVVDIFNGFFIGNSSGKAASIKSIYIGDSNGKARRVVKGYIGDANGRARRFL